MTFIANITTSNQLSFFDIAPNFIGGVAHQCSSIDLRLAIKNILNNIIIN